MTRFGRVRETILRNNKFGIMQATMSFQIQHTLESNVRMYFYKFDFYDLVEVTYDDGHIIVYDFPHSGDGAKVIEDDIERYAGYFESAGLKGKRFLFDISNKLPVTYYDFVQVRKIPNLVFASKTDFAFILDKKNENYITTPGDVKVYVAASVCTAADKLVLSLMNDSIGILKPKKDIDNRASFLSFFLSGMLNGINKKDIEDSIEGIDLNNKFYHSIGRIEFNSDHVEKTIKGLKTDKFIKVTKRAVDEFIDLPPVIDVIKEFRYHASLTEIIAQGLDVYVRREIKNPDKIYTVVIDYDWQSVKSAFIRNGILFITPTTYKPISYFEELVNSSNVQYVIN